MHTLDSSSPAMSARSLITKKWQFAVVFFFLCAFDFSAAIAQQATALTMVGDTVTNPNTGELVTVIGLVREQQDENGQVLAVITDAGDPTSPVVISTLTEVGTTFIDIDGNERIVTEVTDDAMTMLPSSFVTRLVSDTDEPPTSALTLDVVQGSMEVDEPGSPLNRGEGGSPGSGPVTPPIGTSGVITSVATGSNGSDGRDGAGFRICVPYVGCGPFIGVTSQPGEDGGDGPDRNLTISQNPITSTSGSTDAGITIGSRGGNGGQGGDRFTIGNDTEPASPGGAGGAGGNVTLTNNTDVNVSGLDTEGLFVFSQAGSAGDGGDGFSIISGPGGEGGEAGRGGNINATNNATLTTLGDGGHGFRVFSTGGVAGDGGGGFGIVGNAGDGGVGGDGGNVSATQRGTIITEGDGANGILAQSVGGSGGDSGSAGGVVASAGDADSGGNAGTVSVFNEGSIETSGESSRGILAQSIGGGGGSGGGAGGLVALGGAGGSSGDASSVSVTNASSGSILTRGNFSDGISAQSIGGSGGTGSSTGGLVAGSGAGGGSGDGATVTVSNFGTIETQGNDSNGIAAQSIGGGGGSGGGSGGLVALGGSGGGAGDGGTVTVSNIGNGSISTFGERSAGILAQSVGGGGGSGSNNGGLVADAGSGGGAGNGGNVNVTNQGWLVTREADSAGIFAQSVGGGGGSGGGSGGLVALGGDGGGAGTGGNVEVSNLANGTIFTLGDRSSAISAQSIGGGGGSGSTSGGLVALGGSSGAGSNAGSVTVDNDAILTTTGVRSRGVFAQSVGGGGGEAGATGGLVGLGGSGGLGSNGGNVVVTNDGSITTSGTEAVAIYAQSLGGGGGSAGDSGGIVSIGGGATNGGDGGNVSVTNRGAIETSGLGAKGVFAESVGGGGGDGGASYGAFVSIGGNGGTGSDGGQVTVLNQQTIRTLGEYGIGIHAQSVGGGGGDGGSSFSASAFVGFGLGGDGAGGGDGGVTSVQLSQFDDNGVLTPSSIITQGDRATGILAQSVGGGGGSGGTSVQTTAGAFVSLSTSIGGDGGAGGEGGTVNLNGIGDVATQGDLAAGVILQSVGGGGGNAGNTIASSAAAGTGVSLAGSLALGGQGGAAGNGGTVRTDITSEIETQGKFSTGFLAQSVGGGGGNGGAVAAGAASLADGASGTVGIAVGGDAGAGGAGGLVDVSLAGAVTTGDDQSDGIVVQSIGGGGGNAGTTVAATLAAAAGAAGNLSVGIGGDGGAAGNGGSATADIDADINTNGDGSDGLIVQSIGGGGGNSGLTVGAGLAGAGGGAGSVNVGVGGDGGSAGDGGIVVLDYVGDLTTNGDNATGILAQSVGGGGGNSGGTIAAGLAGGGTGAGNVSVSVGGDGGAGGDGGQAGIDRAVTLNTSGSVRTNGESSSGIIAQSIGGGGGNGGYAVAGGLSGGGVGAGTVNIGLGGSGNSGGEGKEVFADIDSVVVTEQDNSTGVLVQSVGGGGGNGGFSVAAGLSGAGTGSAAVSVGLGGEGGQGNVAGNVIASSSQQITTLGDQSSGFVAQSIGGGGGNGGFNVAASLSGAGTGSGAVSVGLGGDGGSGSNSGSVDADVTADVVTVGERSTGILAQSVGGGGGNASFNVAAGLSGAGTGSAAVSVGLGGDGGIGSNGNDVDLLVDANVFTFGGDNSGAVFGSPTFFADLIAAYTDALSAQTPLESGDADSTAIIAQSIGGGGGNGGTNITASGTGSGTASGGVSVGLGGDGGVGGDAGNVTANVSGQLLTVGNGSGGLLAQSIGGGGGNGGANISGVVSGAGTGNAAVNVGLGGRGSTGGIGGDVDLDFTGPVNTFGNNARGIVAQSIGGGGGNGAVNVAGTLAGAGTGSGDVTIAIGGDGGSGATSGVVSADVSGDVSTVGDFSDGVIAQSIGGGGGNSAINIAASASGAGTGNGAVRVGLGGSGGDGANSNSVTANYQGTLITSGDFSRGILAQSIGGGGGNAAGSITAGVSGAGTGNGDISVGLGGSGGAAGNGGADGVATAVNATASGQILTQGDNSTAFTAQSIGGGGGSGGFNVTASGSGAGTGAAGVAVGLGGDGGGGGDGRGVDVDVTSTIQTQGDNSGGILAQSLGGGGGNGGFNVTAAIAGAGTGAAGVAVGLGGDGDGGGDAGRVEADASGTILTEGDNSAAFTAQSIGGGGGNGGFNVTVGASGGGTGSGAVSVGLGGNGDGGGMAGDVFASTSETVVTLGDNSGGVIAQSLGGGGGSGGFNVNVAGSAAGTGSGAIGVGLGGDGAGGGDGARVELTVENDVTTEGENSTGILAQSLGGGGGNGAFNVNVAPSGSGSGSGAVSVGLGGSGAGGGDGGTVIFGGIGDVQTGDPTELISSSNNDASGDFSSGVIVQSIGGGGGSGGFNVSVGASASGNGSAAIGVGLGGDGAGGGDGGVVDSTFVGDISTAGQAAKGLLAQSVGGGGGNGGFSVAVAASGARSGSAAVGVSLGGSGAGGGDGDSVTSSNTGDVFTFGDQSTGVSAQSIGGGGGSGGFAIAGTLSAAQSASGALSLGIGGTGGGGGNAGVVDNTTVGDVVTFGDGSGGILAQSIGGGGGDGGFSVAGAVSLAKNTAGALSVGIGGSGGDGGTGAAVSNSVTGDVFSEGNDSFGIAAQSIGGGGGNGGLNITGTLAIAKSNAGSVGIGIGGSGGDGGEAGDVDNVVDGFVGTLGDNADGILAQSLGGGGGNGGLNITANITASKSGSGNLGVGIGGFGGAGGNAGDVTNDIIGGVVTEGDNADGIVAQSLGGGGGNGAINVTGAVNLTADGSGAGIGVGIGGFGAQGGDAGSVDSTIITTDEFDRISTSGDNSSAAIAQSIGGGGGNGGLNVTGVINASRNGSGASIGFGLGGFGGGAGNADDVSLSVDGLVTTLGSNSHGLVAQSIGGGGGNGGTNVTGTIALTTSNSDSNAVGASIGIGGFGGDGGNSGDVTVSHDGSIIVASDTVALIDQDIDPESGDLVSPGRLVLLGTQGTELAEGQLVTGSHGLVAQSIGGGGGNGGVNVSGNVSLSRGDMTEGIGLAFGVGGFGGDGGETGSVEVDVTGENIFAAGPGRSGVLAQSIGGGGGDGATNISGAIATTEPITVGVGGFGGSAGVGREVDVDVDADILVIGAGDDRDTASAGILAQSIGGGGGNGGLNVSAGIALDAQENRPSLNVGVGGFGGAGAASGQVDVTHDGSISTTGAWSAGVLAQSIAGGGGNGSTNLSRTRNSAADGQTGGINDVAIVAGVGGSGGAGADAGDVTVNQFGAVITEGDYSRGVAAQSIGGGGGNGGLNVTGVVTEQSSPVSVGVGGTGSGGGHAGSATVNRGAIDASTGLITTLGAASFGIEASSIGGGGGNAGQNFNTTFSQTGASSSNQDTQPQGGEDEASQGFAVNIAIGGAGGEAGNGGAAAVNNFSDIVTLGDNSHGIISQSIGGGGGNGNFNIGMSTADGSSDIPDELDDFGTARDAIQNLFTGNSVDATDDDSESMDADEESVDNNNLGLAIAIGGQPGEGGTGATSDVLQVGDITTQGNDAYGILSQSIGGGGGNVGLDLAQVNVGGGNLVITVGRRGGTGGSAGDVTLSSDGEIRTSGENSYGTLAQSIGNGGGNSSSVSVNVGIPASESENDNGNTDSTNGVGSIADADSEEESAEERSLTVSVGLEGGVGGSAGNVSSSISGLIATEGSNAHAVFAQSIGGGGGNGGAASTTDLSGTSLGVSVGGTGGEGGTGGDVQVTSSALLTTVGEGALGILAQSIGGGGGTGGAVEGGGSSIGSKSIEVNVGGGGGTGNVSGDVAVDNSGVIFTQGDDAQGILAQSIGGGGGDASLVSNENNSTVDGERSRGLIVVGGVGGEGAESGDINITNRSAVITNGDRSAGVVAQTIGGGGGNASLITTSSATGETGLSGSLTIGGNGGVGGIAGDIDIDNATIAQSIEGQELDGIVTDGEASHGIFATSIGGGGGNGSTIATSLSSGEESSVNSLSVSIGGSGGAGGTGGDVSIVNQSLIQTTGNQAVGIFAQSIGGGGGNASAVTTTFEISEEESDESEQDSNNLSTANAIGLVLGGEGGTGNTAGLVTVANSSNIITTGEAGSGIVAQSIGGGGGSASAITSSTAALGNVNNASINIGGSGGVGGAAGDVIVENTASATEGIITLGDRAHGVSASSVGGGGGDASNLSNSLVGGADSAVNSLVLNVGGIGGIGGTGGDVTLANSSRIQTQGDAAHAVLAQSIGGGGGNGGVISNIEQVTETEDAIAATDFSIEPDASIGASNSINLALGGEGGSGNTSGSVAVINTGTVITLGEASVGILAQSVGGGGGIASAVSTNTSASTTGNAGVLSLGANGGEGGVAGDVLVENLVANQASLENSDDIVGIVTIGDRSHAVFATSIGGGGGIGSAVSNTFDSVAQSSANSLNLGVGGSGGVGGVGGNVIVNNESRINTLGNQAHGILAQSIGGGGGNGGASIFTEQNQDSVAGGASGNGATSIGLTVGGQGGSANSSGTVLVTNSGEIVTNGDGSFGVYAQSVGGGGGDGGIATTIDAQTSGGTLDQARQSISLSNLALGGDGGAGADGGDVRVTNSGQISSGGNDAIGIFAQSVGGGGGNSGATVSGLASDALNFVFDLAAGSRNGADGVAGEVVVDNTGDILLVGDRSQAILSQSVNGGGGNTELFLDISQQAVVEQDTIDIDDQGVDLPDNGLEQESQMDFVGGVIRAGASALFDAVGADTVVSQIGDITSVGGDSSGLTAQSIGGGGGVSDTNIFLSDSQDQNVDIDAGLGGTDVSDSAGGSLSALTDGDILLTGDHSQGASIQSIGGGGGNVEVSAQVRAQDPPNSIESGESALPNGNENTAIDSELEDVSHTVTIIANLGAVGGDNNDGGDIDLNSNGQQLTLGDFSPGTVVQSIGAGGGQLSLQGASDATIGLGGSGDAVGNAGDIIVANTGGLIATVGDASHAVVLQSIGGGGGLVVTDSLADQVTFDLNDQNAGNGGAISFSQGDSVLVSGVGSFGVIAQSLGGGGGVIDNIFLGSAGGVGSAAGIDLSIGGDAITEGVSGVALFAQSEASSDTGDIFINVGRTLGAFADLSSGVIALSESGTVSGDIEISIGGDLLAIGESAAGLIARSTGSSSSGDIDVSISGLLANSGSNSAGLDVITLANDPAGFAGDISFLLDGSLNSSGVNGVGVSLLTEGGSSGTLNANVGGSVVSQGASSTGVILVSNAINGNSGDVNIAISGQTQSSGQSSSGLVIENSAAQNTGSTSISLGGNVTASGTNSLAVSATNSGGGNSGDINLNLNGFLSSNGFNSTGVSLISQGSSSGDVNAVVSGGVNSTGNSSTSVVLGTNASGGNSGNVQLDISGNTVSTGSNAQVLVVDNIATGSAGSIQINLGGSLIASGNDSVGITAMSRSSVSGGGIQINTANGAQVFAGAGGNAVVVDGSAIASSLVTLNGPTSTADGLLGDVIIGRASSDAVINQQLFVGQFDLGGGVNRFDNNGVFIAGPELSLGASNNILLNNAQFLSGDQGNAQTINLAGSFVQTSGAVSFVDLDFESGQIDQVLATGTAALDGQLILDLLSPELIPAGQFSQVLFGTQSGVTDNGIELITAPSLVANFEIDFSNPLDATLDFTVDFAVDGLGPNLAAAGDYINRLQNAGSSAALANDIVTLLFQSDFDQYRAALTSILPDFYGEQQVQVINSSLAFANRLLSCKQADGIFRFNAEGACAWLTGGDESFEHRAFLDFQAVDFDTDFVSAGGQFDIGNNWFLGFGVSREDVSGLGNNGAWVSDGRTTQVGLSIKYQPNAWKFSAVTGFGLNETDTVRAGGISVPFVSEASRDIDAKSLLLNASYDVFFKNGYFRPALQLGALRIDTDATNEVGGGPLALEIQSGDENYTWSLPALEVGYEFNLSREFKLRSYGRFGFRHYFGSEQASTSAQLAGVDVAIDPFTTQIEIGQDAFQTVLGLDLLLWKNSLLQFQYRRETADEIELEAGQVKVSIPF